MGAQPQHAPLNEPLFAYGKWLPWPQYTHAAVTTASVAWHGAWPPSCLATICCTCFSRYSQSSLGFCAAVAWCSAFACRQATAKLCVHAGSAVHVPDNAKACLLLPQVVCELPLSAEHQHFADLQQLADLLSSSCSDTALSKDIASVQLLLSRLAQDAGKDQQQLQPDAVEQLLDRVQELSLHDLPMPGAAAAAGSEPAVPAVPRTAGKSCGQGAAAAGRATVARTGAGRRTAARRAKDSSSEAEDSSEAESEEESDSGSSSEEGAEQREVGMAAATAAGKGVAGDSTAEGAGRRSSVARQPLAPTTIVNSLQ